MTAASKTQKKLLAENEALRVRLQEAKDNNTAQRHTRESATADTSSASIIEQASEAVIVCDARGRIIRASRSACELCGTNPLLKPFNKTFRLRMAESGDTFSLIPHMRKGGFTCIEVTFKHHDDHVVDLLLTASSLKNFLNQNVGSVVTLTDISQRKPALLDSEVRLPATGSHFQITDEEFQVVNNGLRERNYELARLWDLTKKSEGALRESEKRYHNLFENMLDGYAFHKMLFDDQGHPADYVFLEVNRAFETLTGLENILGKRVTEVIPGFIDSNRDLLEIYGRVVMSGRAEKFEMEVKSLRKWFSISVYSPEKEYFATVFDDITVRKSADATLHESEERYRLLAETMLQGVVHQDANGTIISMNPAAERILGKSHAQFVGSNSVQEEYDTIRENGEHFPGMEHPAMIALQSGQSVHGVVMGVYNPHCNEYRWINIDAVPVFRPGDTAPSEVYSVFGDITARKQAENALQKAHEDMERRVRERTEDLAITIEQLQSEITERKRAEKSLRNETAKRLQAVEALRKKEQMFLQQSRQAAMGEMIGNIAHQWRQPLNTLGLITQRHGAFYGTPAFNKEYLDNSITKSMEIIQHMSKTIDDFRNYFKPEKEKTDFPVIEAINHTLSLLEGSFQNPKITIEVRKLDNPVINGYQNKFSQVILNILVNSRDAVMERLIDNARITITLGSESDCTVVTIADNAGGIPEDVINKIFDPYFSTKGPQQGTGVGLFMSKSIIEKNMGGILSVRNVDNGAEFRIEVKNGKRN